MSYGIRCTWVVLCVSLPQLSGKHLFTSKSNKRIFQRFPDLIIINRYERPAGLFITLYVYIIYVIALRFEGSVVLLDVFGPVFNLRLDLSQT